VKESGELTTVKIRYKTPEGARSKLLSRVVTDAHDDLASMSADFRWAAAIAGVGMMLRESPYRGNLSWKQVQAMAEAAVGPDEARGRPVPPASGRLGTWPCRNSSFSSSSSSTSPCGWRSPTRS
jgi:hypothetical protein